MLDVLDGKVTKALSSLDWHPPKAFVPNRPHQMPYCSYSLNRPLNLFLR